MASCFTVAFTGDQGVPPDGSAANGGGGVVMAASTDGGVRVQSCSYTAGGVESGAVLRTGGHTETTADDAAVVPFHDPAHGLDGAVVFARVGPARDADGGLFCIVRHEDGSWTVGGVPEPAAAADPAAWPGAEFAAAVDRACAEMAAAAPPRPDAHSAAFPGGGIHADWTVAPGAAVDWCAVVERMLAHCEAAGGWFCV